MLEIGAIRKSNLPWASAVVLVRKKDGALRFCIDLRKINARMVKDAQTLPRIKESLDSLNGAVIFTCLDLKSGYWQVELDEESIPVYGIYGGTVRVFRMSPNAIRFNKCPCDFPEVDGIVSR